MSSLREIATPQHYQVLERLRRLGESNPPPLDNVNCRFHGGVGYRDFIADPDQVGGDTTEPVTTSVWTVQRRTPRKR